MLSSLKERVLFFLCSIEFDRDDELFATAGVSRCIKVFDFSSVSSKNLGEHSFIYIPIESSFLNIA